MADPTRHLGSGPLTVPVSLESPSAVCMEPSVPLAGVMGCPHARCCEPLRVLGPEPLLLCPSLAPLRSRSYFLGTTWRIEGTLRRRSLKEKLRGRFQSHVAEQSPFGHTSLLMSCIWYFLTFPWPWGHDWCLFPLCQGGVLCPPVTQ